MNKHFFEVWVSSPEGSYKENTYLSVENAVRDTVKKIEKVKENYGDEYEDEPDFSFEILMKELSEDWRTARHYDYRIVRRTFADA